METYISFGNHSILLWSRQLFIDVRAKKMADKTLQSWDTSVIFSWTSFSQASCLNEFKAMVSVTWITYRWIQQRSVQFQRTVALLQGWRFYSILFYIKIHNTVWKYLKKSPETSRKTAKQYTHHHLRAQPFWHATYPYFTDCRVDFPVPQTQNISVQMKENKKK